MRNVGPRDAEDARIADERPGGELGQLPIEARRQIVLDLADLLLHQMVVVDQPFRRRRDGVAFAHRGGDGAIGLEQN